ncbi:MAG: hypothetical protein M3Z29_13065, partial [Pseudomonadota bacterium]|nr:hypothetical protein [Pseudomonadota bacterium]
MTPADIDRVFGRDRLRMVTGEHVEVFREASQPGERRRYTKRFLATSVGDFREWTEREWRILARLVGHGIKPVPDVVQFDRGAADRPALVQTYDAGVTVDHWATLLPLQRDGKLLRNVFEDCAHWWALAQHSLIALDAIHELRLVHLDLKADNICIPVGPADFDPLVREQSLHPRFEDITLIDFAFSLVSGERLQNALPIARQPDFEYQSPRLLLALEAGRNGDLAPTRQLDWRCDLFSLAAMLWRYLPEFDESTGRAWTRPRHSKARALVRRLIEAHDSDLPQTRPHAELIALASAPLDNPELRQSLERGWALAIETPAPAAVRPTPVTRIAQPLPTPVAAPIEPVFAPSPAFAPGPTAGTLPAQTPRAETSAQAPPAKASLAQTPPAQTPAQTSLAQTPPVPPPYVQPPAQASAAPPAMAEAAAMAPPAPDPTLQQPPGLDRAPFETRPLPHPRADDTGVDHAGFDHAPMSVDESDVETRALARRQRERQRARRLAWTAGVAATAVAGVVLWAPWSESTRMPSLPGLQGARLEAKTGASSAAGRSVAAAKPARPVRADPSAATRTAPRPGADPTATAPRVAVVV